MALSSGGGRGRTDFSGWYGKKRLHIFLVASNLTVITTNCTYNVHVNTELRVQISCTDLNFIPWR
jgi:hypothetical protein